MAEAESRKRKRRGGKGKKKTEKKRQVTSPPCEPKAINGRVRSNQHEAANSSRSNPSKPSTFLDMMKARLTGGHFRMINEKLYTCTGNDALEYFKQNPSLFTLYHKGYQEQMSHWPELPVNVIIRWLKDRSPSLVVADFGCGQALLAKSVKNKVYSIDLVSNEPAVIACDMSKTPLDSSSIDVAVFCLSLMGTDFSKYLREAHRVLKPNGWLLIAEVKSRFDPNTGGADPKKFTKSVCGLGFSLISEDFSNKMFILLHFKKKVSQQTDCKDIEWPELKPCLYKRR